MKKKILTLGLMLIAASCISVEASCPVSQEAKCTCGCVTKCGKSSIFAAKRYKRYIKRVQQSRATVYNALDLTDEQIKAREDLLAENDPVYKEKFDKLIKEASRLEDLKQANASEIDICKQKKVIKNIKKDIQNLVDKENKAFKKCLTRDQRSKYSMIKKLERDDFKKACKHKKDYYKSNPKMKPFGCPQKPACPCSCKDAK